MNLDSDEKMIKTYADNCGWITRTIGLPNEKHAVAYFGTSSGKEPDLFGTIYITNKRIIYENLDKSRILLSINHDDVTTTTGSNSTRFGLGQLCIYFENDAEEDGLRLPSGIELSDYLNATFYTDEEKLRRIIKRAKDREKHLDYNGAIQLYESIGNDKEAARVRRKMLDEKKVDQTVIHGDQVTKTEIKDSVLNRSNVGSGGSSKMQELKDLAEMKKEGLISDEEYEKMKQEIIG